MLADGGLADGVSAIYDAYTGYFLYFLLHPLIGPTITVRMGTVSGSQQWPVPRAVVSKATAHRRATGSAVCGRMPWVSEPGLVEPTSGR